MEKKLILGGILGGIALFAWLGLSWAVLPFHMSALRVFPDDFVVTQSELAREDGGVQWEHGIYYSEMPKYGEEIAYLGADIPFMVFLPGGYVNAPSQPVVMLKGLLLSILAALLVTFIVATSRQPNYKARVALCTAIGAVVALAGPMTFGNFFFFPFDFLWPEVTDQLIGWTLAGLVIAGFTNPVPVRGTTQ